MTVILAIMGVVPLALLAGIALPRAADRLQFVLSVAALGAGLLFCWLVFPWHLLSIYYRLALPVALLAAGWFAWRRIRSPDEPPVPAWQRWLNGGLSVALLALFSWLCSLALGGYRAPEGALLLANPLPAGDVVVSHGGASPLINAHARVPAQAHALDIVGLNGWGSRAAGLGEVPELTAYAIFGQPVVAPCAGPVLQAVDGLEDLPIGQYDRDNLAGNHVVLSCGGAELWLAHLRQGSVRVRAGDRVTAGMPLGEVGNSGNTSEPHLHLHAERGGELQRLNDGEGVPLLIEGRYLVRGNRL